MPGNQSFLYEIKSWMGIDNLTTDDMRVDPSFFRTFNNADIDDEGMVHLRKGRKRLLISGAFSSLCPYGFGVKDGNLVRINPDWTITILVAGVGTSRMGFVKVLDRVFFGNRHVIGYIDDGVAYGFPEPSADRKASGRQRMVGGEILEYFDARLYAVQGGQVFRSVAAVPFEMDLAALDPELAGWYTPGGPITMFHAVKDGVYISAGERVVFAGGKDLGDYTQVLDSPAIEGSAVAIEGMDLGRGAVGRVVLFHTKIGVYRGLPGGILQDLTGKHYGVSGAQRGTACVASPNGYYQYFFMAEAEWQVRMGATLPAITGSSEAPSTPDSEIYDGGEAGTTVWDGNADGGSA